MLPLYPSPELYPSPDLYPGGVEVLVTSLPNAALETISEAAEDIVDAAVAHVRKDLSHPGSEWAVPLAFVILLRLVAQRVIVARADRA